MSFARKPTTLNLESKKVLDEKLRLIFDSNNSSKLNFETKNLFLGNNPIDGIKKILKGV